MSALEIISFLLLLAALFSYINERFIKIPSTIALMLLALIFSLSLAFFHHLGFDLGYYKAVNKMITELDFSRLVLDGVLCFLLFAGALSISLKSLEKQKNQVITLAFLATFVAVLTIGTLSWLFFQLVGMPIPYIYSLIFAAIISPTDPIAALAILKSMGLPEKLKVIIDGESQFNDGVGVVLFVTFTGIAFGTTKPTAAHIAGMFLQEVIGGIGLGIAMAAVTHTMLKGVSQIATQLLITLAAVTLGYSSSELLGVSGPIACVIAGLLVGSYSLQKATDAPSRQHITNFWDMVNQILVAVLFVLIGLEVLILQSSKPQYFLYSFAAILIVLFGRYLSIVISMLALKLPKKLKTSSLFKLANLFTWSGLRGALAIALVSSLPENQYKGLLATMTYIIVVFSILVQGSSIPLLFSPKELKQLAGDD